MNFKEHLLDYKDPEERVTLSWDFTPDLGADTILGAPVVTVAVKRGGADPAVGTMIYAAASVVGNKVLVVRFLQIRFLSLILKF